MNNFLKLCANETEKIFKKKSTVIFIIILLLTILASVGMTYLMKVSTDIINDDSSASFNLAFSKVAMENLEKEGKTNTLDYVRNKTEFEMQEFAEKNGIKKLRESNVWTSSVYNHMYILKTEIYTKEIVPSNSEYASRLTDEEYNEKKNEFKKLELLVVNKDFDGYIKEQKANINKDFEKEQITEEQKDIKMYLTELQEKYKINYDYNDENTWKSTALKEIEVAKESLRTGINSETNKTLTLKQNEEYKDIITLNEYRLSNNIPTTVTSGNLANLRQVFVNMSEEMTMGVLGLFMIILAGGILSREFSKGTIKLLMITPAKRWKILLAKLVTVMVILLVFTVILSLLTSLVGKVVFGGFELSPYIEATDGVIHSISPIIYSLLRFLTYTIDIAIYMLLAMMISTLFRSTSAAVGTSIFFYMGSSVMMLIVNNILKKEWIKFIPFNNMKLTNKIFSAETGILSDINTVMMSNQIVTNITITFSLLLLLVCAILMVLTMFDSFNKKDIT